MITNKMYDAEQEYEDRYLLAAGGYAHMIKYRAECDIYHNHKDCGYLTFSGNYDGNPWSTCPYLELDEKPFDPFLDTVSWYRYGDRIIYTKIEKTERMRQFISELKQRLEAEGFHNVDVSAKICEERRFEKKRGIFKDKITSQATGIKGFAVFYSVEW